MVKARASLCEGDCDLERCRVSNASTPPTPTHPCPCPAACRSLSCPPGPLSHPAQELQDPQGPPPWTQGQVAHVLPASQWRVTWCSAISTASHWMQPSARAAVDISLLGSSPTTGPPMVSPALRSVLCERGQLVGATQRRQQSPPKESSLWCSQTCPSPWHRPGAPLRGTYLGRST